MSSPNKGSAADGAANKGKEKQQESKQDKNKKVSIPSNSAWVKPPAGLKPNAPASASAAASSSSTSSASTSAASASSSSSSSSTPSSAPSSHTPPAAASTSAPASTSSSSTPAATSQSSQSSEKSSSSKKNKREPRVVKMTPAGEAAAAAAAAAADASAPSSDAATPATTPASTESHAEPAENKSSSSSSSSSQPKPLNAWSKPGSSILSSMSSQPSKSSSASASTSSSSSSAKHDQSHAATTTSSASAAPASSTHSETSASSAAPATASHQSNTAASQPSASSSTTSQSSSAQAHASSAVASSHTNTSSGTAHVATGSAWEKANHVVDPRSHEEIERSESPELGVEFESKNDSTGETEHPLETPWTFYFDKKLPKGTDFKHFEQNLRKLGTVRTIEDLWRQYSWFMSPDQMPKDINLFMFRHNAVPAWENFPNGGCWIIKVRKKNGLIDRLWEELVFAAAGEHFAEPSIIGIELSTRGREDLLSVWNRDNTNPELRYIIGDRLKKILNLDDSTVAEYKLFSSALRDGSTFRNAKPYVYAAAGENDGSQPPTIAE